MNNTVVCSKFELIATPSLAFGLRVVVHQTSLQLQNGKRPSYCALQAAGDRA